MNKVEMELNFTNKLEVSPLAKSPGGAEDSFDSNIWLDLQSYLYKEQVLKNSEIEVDQIISILGISPTSRILDVACGPGRHAFEFSRRNYHVTAYDIHPAIIQTNIQKAKLQGVSVEWLQRDMMTYCQPDAFDVCLNLFYSFGFFQDRSNTIKVLSNFFRCLRSGGKLLMQLLPREWMEKWFYPKHWERLEDGEFFLYEKKIDYDAGWLQEAFTIIKEGKTQHYTIGTQIYYADEIVELLKKCGFVDLQIYGGLDLSPYDDKASSLVVKGQKPIVKSNMIRC